MNQSKLFDAPFKSILTLVDFTGRGLGFKYEPSLPIGPSQQPDQKNALRAFFNARKHGHGIWKWEHYFDIYDRHFQRFRGRDVHVLEIGIYSGGSLEMWRDYFGSGAHIYGVDVQAECKAYENETTKIFIGDQADRRFWGQFRAQVPMLDIAIDDGGHRPEQQIATFEELLPHLRPGGIFLTEDIHGVFNPFSSYMHGLTQKLNNFDRVKSNFDDMNRRISCASTPFQAAIGSVHFYPYVTVVEKNVAAVAEFVSPKHGTQWQPFLK